MTRRALFQTRATLAAALARLARLVEPHEYVPPARPPAPELRQRLWALVTAQAPQQATTREAVTTWILERTSLPLHPENYGEIVRRLEKVD